MNPLLQESSTIPFAAVEPAMLRPAVDALLADARQKLEAVAAAAPTAADVLEAFDRATVDLDWMLGVASHMEAVQGTKALRDAWAAVQPDVAAFYSSIFTSTPLFRALSRFAETPEAKALDAARARFLHKSLDDFRRNGAELDDAGKKRLSDIDVALNELTLRFSQNVVDATSAFEHVVTDVSALAGLPSGVIEAARRSAEEKGLAGYRLTLHAPCYGPVLTYADDRGLRERLYRAQSTRATASPIDNRPIVLEVLKLRREKASLLGFSNFADLVTSDRMAKSGDAAWSFVDGLRARIQAAFERENRELEDFARGEAGAAVLPFAPWDVAYWAERMRRARHDFDEETLRPYFSLPTVLAGLFEIVQRLYGISIAEATSVATWHRDVKAFHITSEAGRRLGTFFVDPYPRDEKRDGAWMGSLADRVPGLRADEHVAVVVCNMTPPTAPGKPALLSHREVQTLFHEVGHMLHHCLSAVELRSQCGTRVASDFVELPSMIHENWCWEPEALALFARHFETGEVIPPPLVDKMRGARAFRAANALMRQLGFSTVDLELHMKLDLDGPVDVIDHARRVFERFSPTALPADYAMLASFSHLFGSPYGYAAGYYSYQWSERLDADAFGRFASEGVLSRDVGRAFAEHVLSRGDSADPAELYRAFLGRDPDDRALIRRLGLA